MNGLGTEVQSRPQEEPPDWPQRSGEPSQPLVSLLAEQALLTSGTGLAIGTLRGRSKGGGVTIRWAVLSGSGTAR
ncbi:hypothetical protein EYF80_057165 [Liparis tanakae]|uniref:Uncharacterized protein n=1 Tax=Liparis tanakae TaxID=230148 RepID=A0A4Z2EWP4_9TELE|nr:hypothetical protein EYF80_057165 [Liparis tanakae]